jgi:hypothetical protein
MEYRFNETERAFCAEKVHLIRQTQAELAGALQLIARAHGFTVPVNYSDTFDRMYTDEQEEPHGSVAPMAETDRTVTQIGNGAVR